VRVTAATFGAGGTFRFAVVDDGDPLAVVPVPVMLTVLRLARLKGMPASTAADLLRTGCGRTRAMGSRALAHAAEVIAATSVDVPTEASSHD
jgi:hypothetical protein